MITGSEGEVITGSEEEVITGSEGEVITGSEGEVIRDIINACGATNICQHTMQKGYVRKTYDLASE